MVTAINRLKYQLNRFPSKFSDFTEEDLSHKPFPNKWCKKEILGHLIDSATNNHHRFIKALYNPEITRIQTYDQNLWVNANNYLNLESKQILNFWIAYNTHLLQFIISIPENKYNQLCDIGNPNLVTLEWLINDYVDHLEHHIDQILR